MFSLQLFGNSLKWCGQSLRELFSVGKTACSVVYHELARKMFTDALSAIELYRYDVTMAKGWPKSPNKLAIEVISSSNHCVHLVSTTQQEPVLNGYSWDIKWMLTDSCMYSNARFWSGGCEGEYYDTRSYMTRLNEHVFESLWDLNRHNQPFIREISHPFSKWIEIRKCLQLSWVTNLKVKLNRACLLIWILVTTTQSWK